MSENASYELIITRIFDAPREPVYRAFVDPDQLARWFGPVGWTVPRETVEIDARPGGRQRFVMVSADDPHVTSTVDAEFAEVVENELLVGKQDVAHPRGQPGPTGTLTLRVEFHDEAGRKTLLVIRQGPYSEELEGQARQGWEGSFGKLDELLAGR
jgi:uncharacterized protein YndB with AHSA1/START domain